MEIARAPRVEARLLRRYKRFLADVELADGRELTVHCPNPGSLQGCLPERARVVLRDSANPARKLRWTLETIEVDGTWVNVDTSLPNGVVAAAVAAGRIPELAGYPELRREVRYGEASRIDLLLERPAGGGARGGAERCWVEVKATTLVRGRVARFPDAVTARGRKHLEELARMAAAGDRAVILFLAGRGDVGAFEPAADIDPAWAETLARVTAQGVEVLAYGARVAPGRLALGEPLRVALRDGSAAAPG
jgi:sugar fermentation stimulation protein A